MPEKIGGQPDLQVPIVANQPQIKGSAIAVNEKQKVEFPTDKVEIGSKQELKVNGYKQPEIKNYHNEIKEIFTLIKEGSKQINPDDDRVVIVVGDTGSGKSTLVNCLAGAKLTAFKPSNTKKLAIELQVQEEHHAKIGHGGKSETFLPKKLKDESNGRVFWDLPGFEDTRGPKLDIPNTFYIDKIFSNAKEMKVLAVIDESAITGPRRGQSFKELIVRLSSMFENNIEKLADSMVIVFTKSVAIEDFQLELAKIIDDDNSLNNEQRAILRAVVEKSAIAVFNQPTQVGDIAASGDREKILSALEKVHYVEQPQVNLTLSKDSLTVVADMLQWYNESIREDVSILAHELQVTCDIVAVGTAKANAQNHLYLPLANEQIIDLTGTNGNVNLGDTITIGTGANKKEIPMRNSVNLTIGMSPECLLKELELLKNNIKDLAEQPFETDMQIIEYIEEKIAPSYIELTKADPKKVNEIIQKLKCSVVDVFDGFFKKLMPVDVTGKELRIQQDKLIGAFMTKAYYPLEQSIIGLVHKGNKEKIEQMNQVLEKQRQDNAKSMQEQAALHSQATQALKNEMSSLATQLSNTNTERVNLSSQVSQLKTATVNYENQVSTLNKEVGSYKDHVNSLQQHVKALESRPPQIIHQHHHEKSGGCEVM